LTEKSDYSFRKILLDMAITIPVENLLDAWQAHPLACAGACIT